MKFNENFDELGIDLKHHFCSGMYMKEVSIPAKVELKQHAHHYDHLSILAKGWVSVVVEGVATEHRAPACIKIAAHKRHAVIALTDATWFCAHAVSEEQDVETIDRSLACST